MTTKYINPFTDFGFKKIFGEEENKDLPMHVIKNMISSYQPVSPEEGFDKVISI